ncbi:MAG: cytochrome c biogenesis CcdA family protein [Ktedonobacteraceae bacterium]|jgi:cytochrome c-type biogenesis protein
MDTSQVSFGVAFIAGLASFLSPCILPLVPIYIAQLVGHSVYQAAGEDKQEGRPARLNTFLHALMFVCGFTLAFVTLGATASTVGSFLSSYQILLRQIGGILLVLIGLHLTGILKLSIFYWQKRFEFHPSRPSYPASLLFGIVFAIGWTPCVGLILGPILALAANAATLRQGVTLLLFYSLGMGIPFLLLGLGLNQLSRALNWLKPHLGKIEIGTGVVMIIAGGIIFFNVLPSFNHLFNLGINV